VIAPPATNPPTNHARHSLSPRVDRKIRPTIPLMPAILPFNNRVNPIAKPIKTPPIKDDMGVNSVQFMSFLHRPGFGSVNGTFN
jgi:hypothetical protein